eukprot:5125702-Prymnesium_polylepis.1
MAADMPSRDAQSTHCVDEIKVDSHVASNPNTANNANNGYFSPQYSRSWGYNHTGDCILTIKRTESGRPNEHNNADTRDTWP